MQASASVTIRAGTVRGMHYQRPPHAEAKLVRFVLGPDGALVPDLARKLPGRGVWTAATREAVDLAVKRDAFSRSLKTKAKAPPALADLVAEIERMATDKGCTPAQLALAWVLTQGEDIVPIPGTKRRAYLEDNLGALEVSLTDDDLARIDEVLPPGAAAGTRYAAPQMAALNL